MKTHALLLFFLIAPLFFAFANPRISIGNGTYKSQEFLQEANYYAELLNIPENVFIRINFTLKLKKRSDATLEYRLFNDTIHQVVIYINRGISRSDQLLALAHELVHVKQYVEGELRPLTSSTFLWNRKDEINIKRIPYRERPWEIEAHKFAHDLRKSYLSRNAIRPISLIKNTTKQCIGVNHQHYTLPQLLENPTFLERY